MELVIVRLQRWQALPGATILLVLVSFSFFSLPIKWFPISYALSFTYTANVTNKEYYKWRNALQIYAPTLWPAPSTNVQSRWGEVTSIVIVRHPMSRLASVYYQKFIELCQNKAWPELIESIIQNYRGEGEEGPEDQPTPNEFLRYIKQTKKSVLSP